MTSKRATTYADLKAKNTARLTDHERKIAAKRAEQLTAGGHEDMIERAMPDFLKGHNGAACGVACVVGRRNGSVTFGNWVGCGYCDACQAIMAALVARKKKYEDGRK